MTKIIAIQTTYPDKKKAEELANKILTKKLAACIQIKEITSMYQWKGQIQKDKEFLLVIKTYDNLFANIENIIINHHPYEVPQILAFQISNVNGAYKKWISSILEE